MQRRADEARPATRTGNATENSIHGKVLLEGRGNEAVTEPATAAVKKRRFTGQGLVNVATTT